MKRQKHQGQQMKPIPDQRLMTRAEVARRYGISQRFLELSVARRYGPSFLRIGRLVRYRAVDVQAWLEGQSVDPEAEV